MNNEPFKLEPWNNQRESVTLCHQTLNKKTVLTAFSINGVGKPHSQIQKDETGPLLKN